MDRMRRLASRLIKPVKKFMIIAVLVLALVMLAPRLAVMWYAEPLTFTPEAVPAERVAIVFGAGLQRNGAVTPELSERVQMAAKLYLTHKVEKLLFSGDNRFLNYNEPGAMRQYAMQLGVPKEAIVQDYAGRRTYDTCYRARAIFRVEAAILVTQEYHLPRALYICNTLGLDTVGVPADKPDTPYVYGNLREFPAVADAWWDLYVAHPVPILGQSEPIF